MGFQYLVLTHYRVVTVQEANSRRYSTYHERRLRMTSRNNSDVDPSAEQHAKGRKPYMGLGMGMEVPCPSYEQYCQPQLGQCSTKYCEEIDSPLGQVEHLDLFVFPHPACLETLHGRPLPPIQWKQCTAQFTEFMFTQRLCFI